MVIQNVLRFGVTKTFLARKVWYVDSSRQIKRKKIELILPKVIALDYIPGKLIVREISDTNYKKEHLHPTGFSADTHKIRWYGLPFL